MKPVSSGQRGQRCQKNESMGTVRARPMIAPMRPAGMIEESGRWMCGWR